MIHILAGNSRQAHTLAKVVLHLRDPQYRVVTDIHHLLDTGPAGGTLVRWGSWHDRSDFHELCGLAEARGMLIVDVTDQR